MNYCQTNLSPCRRCIGLVRRYEGPFLIIEKVGKAAYRLELPPKLKIHIVFHVSMLKPFHEDKEDPSRSKSSRALTVVVTEFDKKIGRNPGRKTDKAEGSSKLQRILGHFGRFARK